MSAPDVMAPIPWAIKDRVAGTTRTPTNNRLTAATSALPIVSPSVSELSATSRAAHSVAGRVGGQTCAQLDAAPLARYGSYTPPLITFAAGDANLTTSSAVSPFLVDPQDAQDHAMWLKHGFPWVYWNRY